MARKSSTKTELVVLILLAMCMSHSMAAITCSDVVKNLRPCLGYLSSGSGLPPSSCCAGAKALQSAAATTADRRAACTCLQSISKSMNVKQGLAQSLPRNCGITLRMAISPTVDCTKVT